MALHHAAAGEVVRLASVEDPSIRTIALAKTPAFETIHLVLRAGHTIASHQVAGSMTLYCIDGHIHFEGAGPPELHGGDWVFLGPAMPHEVRALSDSSLLLTILFDEPHANGATEGIS